MKKIIALTLAFIMLLGLAACGKKNTEDEVSGLVGYYSVSNAIMDGNEMDIATLARIGMSEGVYLKLNADGTGELSFEPGAAGPITYDAKAGTISADGKTFPFTVDGDTIAVVFEEGDTSTTMFYTRDGDAASGTDSADGVGDLAAAGSFDFASVTIADSLNDVFENARTVSGFVSSTTAITAGSRWYGVMAFSNFKGVEYDDYSVDVVGELATTSQGYDYFEISDSDGELVLSLYVEVYDDGLHADIGKDDAWLFNRYLTEDEEHYFSPSLINGSIEMEYPYVDPEGDFSCDVRFFLREYGAEWDEENDTLPPDYDQYLANLNG